MAAAEARREFPTASPEVPNATTLFVRDQVRGVLAAMHSTDPENKGVEAGTVYHEIERRTGQEPQFVGVVKALLFLAESGEAIVTVGEKAKIGEKGQSAVPSRYYRLNAKV